ARAEARGGFRRSSGRGTEPRCVAQRGVGRRLFWNDAHARSTRRAAAEKSGGNARITRRDRDGARRGLSVRWVEPILPRRRKLDVLTPKDLRFCCPGTAGGRVP